MKSIVTILETMAQRQLLSGNYIICPEFILKIKHLSQE